MPAPLPPVRPRVRRRLLVTGAALAVSSLLLTGLDPSTGSSPGTEPAPVDASGLVTAAATWSGSDLAPATTCEELLTWQQERAAPLVGPWGWQGGWPVLQRDGGLFDGSVAELSSPGFLPAVTNARAGSLTSVARTDASMDVAQQSATGTNVQEAGVDEPDVAKTDGRLLVRLEQTREQADLVVEDVTGEQVVELGRTTLDVPAAELLLVGDVVVVVGGHRGGGSGPGTTLVRVDLADPARPVATDTAVIDAQRVAVRQHGTTVRLVLETGLPDLDFPAPKGLRRKPAQERAQEDNLATLRATTVDDWLPQVTTYDAGGGETSRRLVDCGDVALPVEQDRDEREPRSEPESPSGDVGTVSVVGFDATQPLDALGGADALGVAVGTDLAYLSTDRLYLATTGGPGWWGGSMPLLNRATDLATDPAMDMATTIVRPLGDGTSRVHEFVLEGTAARYTASGRVDGHVRDRWSMDEHEGVLRLAVGPSQRTADESAVVTLRDDGEGRLVEVGRVDGIGPREDIEAVRWFGDLALVVTFRRIDPLYTVDLSDPAAPRVRGELKIPGYSAYLHPLGPDRLLGLGQGPVERGHWGAQSSLFDLADLDDPQRLDVVSHERWSSHVAEHDPRGFTWLPDRSTGLSVLNDGTGRGPTRLLVLEVVGDRLEQRLVEVPGAPTRRTVYGDTQRIRTLPLPDGRVALVTADAASYVDLDRP